MLRLTVNGLVEGSLSGVEDEELTSLVEGQVSTLEETFAEIRHALAKIEDNRELTDEGKTVRRAQLVEEWRPRLRSALNLDALGRLSRQIETKTRMMHQFSNRLDLEHLDVGEEEAREMVRETRRLLRQKLAEDGGTLEVQRIVGQAAIDDDIITLRAAELAPPSFPLLSDEVLEPIRARHAAEHFPEHAAELQQKRRTLARLQFNANEARERIKELTGEDPLSGPEFYVLQEDYSLEPYEPESEPGAEPEPEPSVTVG